MTRIAVLVLLLLATLTVSAGATATKFESAYPTVTEAGDSAVVFYDFFDTNWQKQAGIHFNSYPLADLSAAQIEELAAQSFFGSTGVAYSLPLTKEYKDARFVFLSADGARPLSITGLEGTVRYNFSNDLKEVISTDFFGEAIGLPEPDMTNAGGFVAILAAGQELPSQEVVGPINPERDSTNSPKRTWKALQQIRYRFSDTGPAYVFVQYEADTACDEDCCAFRYSLFQEDPDTRELTEVRATLYGCDV